MLTKEKLRTAAVVWNTALFLLSAAGLTTLSLLLAIGMDDIQVFFNCFRCPLIFLLNYIPFLLLQLLLLCVFNRQWCAFLGSAAILLTASVGTSTSSNSAGIPSFSPICHP